MPENPFMAFFRSISNPGVPAELWGQLRPWLQRFALNVPKHALPRERPEFCSHVTRSGNDCESLGVLECRACGEVVCLEHAYMNTYAQCVCAQCVSAVASAAREGERAERARDQQKKKRGGKKRRTWSDRRTPPQSPEEDEEFERIEALNVLGLSHTATQDEINARFRELGKELHPDRFTDPKQRERATAKFKKITAAYHVLKNAQAAA